MTAQSSSDVTLTSWASRYARDFVVRHSGCHDVDGTATLQEQYQYTQQSKILIPVDGE